jgi:hypothetical protein
MALLDLFLFFFPANTPFCSITFFLMLNRGKSMTMMIRLVDFLFTLLT